MAERYACGNCVAATEPCEKCALRADRDALRTRLAAAEAVVEALQRVAQAHAPKCCRDECEDVAITEQRTAMGGGRRRWFAYCARHRPDSGPTRQLPWVVTEAALRDYARATGKETT